MGKERTCCRSSVRYHEEPAPRILSDLRDLLNNEFLHAFNRVLLFEAEVEFLFLRISGSSLADAARLYLFTDRLIGGIMPYLKV